MNSFWKLKQFRNLDNKSYSFTAEHFGGASLDCRNQDELFQKKLQS